MYFVQLLTSCLGKLNFYVHVYVTLLHVSCKIFNLMRDFENIKSQDKPERAILLTRVTLTGNGRNERVSSSLCCICLLYSEIISLIHQQSIYFNIFGHNTQVRPS